MEIQKTDEVAVFEELLKTKREIEALNTKSKALSDHAIQILKDRYVKNYKLDGFTITRSNRAVIEIPEEFADTYDTLKAEIQEIRDKQRLFKQNYGIKKPGSDFLIFRKQKPSFPKKMEL